MMTWCFRVLVLVMPVRVRLINTHGLSDYSRMWCIRIVPLLIRASTRARINTMSNALRYDELRSNLFPWCFLMFRVSWLLRFLDKWIFWHLSCVSGVIYLCNRMPHIHSLIVDYIREGLRLLDRICKSKKAPVNCRRCYSRRIRAQFCSPDDMARRVVVLRWILGLGTNFVLGQRKAHNSFLSENQVYNVNMELLIITDEVR